MATNTGKKPWGFFTDTKEGGSGIMVYASFFKKKEQVNSVLKRINREEKEGGIKGKYDKITRKRVKVVAKELKGKAK